MLARVNWVAIVAVVVLNMVAGAAWYGLLADPWLSAIGKGMTDFDGQSALIYLLPILASILNALILATVMQLADEVTPTGGVRWALLLWVGLVFPYALVHNAFSAFPLTLTLPAQSHGSFARDQPTVLLACANTPVYGGGMKIAPQARLDDGLLDICHVTDVNKFKLFCLFPTVYFGRHLSHKDVTYFKTPSVRLETGHPVDVYADGEYVCQTPVEISVEPAALTVIVP